MATHPSRSRGLRLETLENRCMLTGITSVSGMGPIDGGPEGESGSEPNYVPGQLIVEFAPGTSDAARDLVLRRENATQLQTFYGLDYVLVELPGDQVSHQYTGIESAIAHWSSLPEVSSASANEFLFSPKLIPDDQFFVFEWAMNNTGQTGGFPDADIDATEAWDIFTGTSNTVVAIIDTGVDYLHPDLVNNMWRNPGEIPGDGIDNDGNGYIDDIYGIAPGIDAAAVDPMDYDGHGTHVAGTVGAEGNNGIGVAGVNWDVQMMAINVLEGPAGGTQAAVAAGISYATMMREQYGVNVLVSNNSYGGPTGTTLIRDAIALHTASDILFVAAAGNDDSNNDIVAHYPSNYDLDGIVSVAATDQLDFRASYSNYGNASVDIFAPGGDGAAGDLEAILSTWPPAIPDASTGAVGAFYDAIMGTSMASPHVAGAAALIRGLAPEMTALETKALMMGTVDKFPWMLGAVQSGGRLNLNTALERIFTTDVEGTVWRDENGNGLRDVPDEGLANWTVYIDINNNEQLDVDEPSAVTDADGNYTIETYAAPGTHRVREVVKPNWDVTFPADGFQMITIVNRGDVITDVDFGNHPEPGSITGFKWHDVDGDGIHDPGEPGRGGVWIYADLNNDGMIGLLEPAAVTAADGSYAIHGIRAGEVAIRESLPLGWATTYPAMGYHVIEILSAENIPDIDFGNFASFDFGDAPAANGYPTLAVDGGAYHGMTPGYQLGALIDSEPDGIPNATATGDDLTNLADEDGVTIPAAMFQGAVATIDVVVQTSGYPDGYFQGWIDFNADGDWNDAGEQIAKNLRLGDGVHSVTFAVPEAAGVVVGDTFARFRYGIEKDLSPTGGSAVGEVEDYAVLVLKDEPVANADAFSVDQDSGATTLDVLDNDYPSSTGVLTITAVTQPANGTVTIAGDAQSVSYTPDFGTYSPPSDTFTYTIDDGTGKTSTATVTVQVRPTLITPAAVDDVYHIALAGSSDLAVLANDLTGTLGTFQLVDVSTPGSGTAVIDDNGTADPFDDFIVYTPNGTFDKADQFEYTISNANGSSVAIVTLLEDPPGDELSVGLDIDIVDPVTGDPITEIGVDEQFVMIVSVQDIRSGQLPANMGVFSAFLDVLYDRGLVMPVSDPANPTGVDITYSSDYSVVYAGAEGDAFTPGLLNEIGSVATSFSPLGAGKLEVLRVTFTANEVGVANFAADPFDEPVVNTPGGPIVREISFYTPPSAAPYMDVNYGIASLTILDNGAGGAGVGDSTADGSGGTVDSERMNLDVDGNGYISPVDALWIISFLNGATDTSSDPAGIQRDVDGNGYVSPVDALWVISFLNGGEGEGEGAALVSSSSNSSVETQTPDLLASDPATVLATLNAPASSSIVTAQTATPAVTAPVVSATQDWQLQVGQSQADHATVDAATIASQPWESLLDTLAEDVLEAWLDGEDA